MEPDSPDFPQSHPAAAPELDIAAPGITAEPTLPSEGKTDGIMLWLRDILVAIVASVLIITFLYQPVRVEGTSMLPRLENRDRLFINKFIYDFSSIHRGDVVVFHYPLDPAESYIKRVIAIPGDRIWIDRGVVWLNGKPLKEPYVPKMYRDTGSMAEMVIPKGYYFMMGDHRDISSDSRAFGPVKRSLIYGKAVLVYWPERDAGMVR